MTDCSIKINSTKIGINYRPFIIAELSGNHKKSLERAFKIIKLASNAGVDAIKLQAYTPDDITINHDGKGFIINDKKNLWNKRRLYDLYREGSTPFEWYEKIIKFCKKLNLTCFTSVFSVESLKLLEQLDFPAYKIASFENNHYPLIEAVSKTKKPIIVSTGMTNLLDLLEIKKIIKKSHTNFAFLKCTSSYPSDISESNLSTITFLQKKLNCVVGLSDHTPGITAAITSIAFGSSLIEKHITLDNNDGAIDSKFSLTPREFKNLVIEINNAWKSIGKISLKPTISEKKSIKFKRSIYAIDNIKKGEIFTDNNIKVIRPGYGLHPKYFKKLIGKKSINNIKYGNPISIKNIDDKNK